MYWKDLAAQSCCEDADFEEDAEFDADELGLDPEEEEAEEEEGNG